MIIQALNDYYRILLEDPEIGVPQVGYTSTKVKCYATLSKEGDLLELTQMPGEEKDWTEMIVPEQKKRQGIAITPYFLCDNGKHVFGCTFDVKQNQTSRDHFRAFKELHEKVLHGVDNDRSRAIINFVNKWNPDDCLEHEIIQKRLEILNTGGFIVFKLDGETGYLHQDHEIKKAWKRYNAELKDDVTVQCLVTGEEEEMELIHAAIRGVKDAQSAGATLVSAHAKAFKSYQQKTLDINVPVGKSAAFGYTTVLNYLLNNLRHRMQFADATTVFWAEDTDGLCEDLLAQLMNPEKEETEKIGDHAVNTAYVKDSLRCLKEGKPIKEKADVNFYILGLSPNNARLAVRFWYRDHFGQFVQKIWQHHEDMQIVGLRQELIPISRIIFETIPRNAQKKEAAPLLGGALMKSIFTGRAYPQGLFYAIVNRIRSDGEINDIRTGVIKAFLKRNARLQKDEEKERMITVSLNEQNPNVAYRLGRLFAVLEKAQQDAAEGKLNSTIKDRYFGTASASPRSVFPVLMKLVQHHISKAEYGYFSDLKIQEIIQGVDEFPAHLNFEDQGRFILGYYHQREDLYKKRETKKEGE